MSPILTRQRVAYYCTLMLVCALVVQVFSAIRDKEFGGDVSAFYAEGKVALKRPHRDLYNVDVQDEEFSALMGSRLSSPVAFTSWFTIILALLALLPYPIAFAIWSLMSLNAMILGYWFSARALQLPDSWDRLGILVCLAFPPYLFYTLLNGQPSAFAFLSIAFSYWLQRRAHQL